jgi:hypothetical protein
VDPDLMALGKRPKNADKRKSRKRKNRFGIFLSICLRRGGGREKKKRRKRLAHAGQSTRSKGRLFRKKATHLPACCLPAACLPFLGVLKRDLFWGFLKEIFRFLKEFFFYWSETKMKSVMATRFFRCGYGNPRDIFT